MPVIFQESMLDILLQSVFVFIQCQSIHWHSGNELWLPFCALSSPSRSPIDSSLLPQHSNLHIALPSNYKIMACTGPLNVETRNSSLFLGHGLSGSTNHDPASSDIIAISDCYAEVLKAALGGRRKNATPAKVSMFILTHGLIGIDVWKFVCGGKGVSNYFA